ncbi:MAG: DUF2332 domain-containing protein [Parvularculaceae bacterium]
MKFASPAEYYQFFANEARRGGSPLYEALSLLLAEDAGLQALAEKRRKGQPPANILFAAVHYLLLQGDDHPLTAYYPSAGGARPVDEETAPTFRDFCARRETALIALIEAGVTNTNEVGRSALLAPAFSLVAGEAGRPLGLIEIGPSAGLNLNFDRYRLRFTNAAGATVLERWGPSRLTIDCELRGDRHPVIPDKPPAVASRIGLELHPVSIADAAARLWLKALVWPERLDRLRRLDATLAIAVDHPPPIRAGDALELLHSAIAKIARAAEPCVFHTMTTYQFTEARRAELEQLFIDASRARPIWRVSVDMSDKAGVYPLRATRYERGKAVTRDLALCDSHGLWIDWG